MNTITHTGSYMSDEKILEITDFKKVNGETIRVKQSNIKKSKSKSKSKKSKDAVPVTPDYSMHEVSFEDEVAFVFEQNEILYHELVKAQTQVKTLEKVINKVLKVNNELQNKK